MVANFISLGPTSFMTHILAIDTSTDACSVALSANGTVTGLFELAAKSHTQRLLPMVEELLHQCHCGLENLDAIAFGRGPGSFTGLRIGLGVVQGLAFARRLPVIPVSTLAAMAAGYWRRNPDAAVRPVLTSLDARMNEVYWSVYRACSGQQTPEQVIEEQVISPASAASAMNDWEEAFDGIGQGWHYDELRSLDPHTIEQACYPAAEDIARLAVEAFTRGEAVPVQEARPVYLRDTVSWKKRTRIRS
ncbi:tRNA (adenosine(37)-N6)-threonylcarbamoyltransferase complex dimerization subunit type 1 TsaB [Marinimicrobium sp. ABcell2]|uniref:tRNA (adenosine(37)-N6)-threonylcarbamoyltransferase complex dimerization subunit type 1 TsaB n=1 Tax=Marinimicrobium sp. ABcell2 TaxID=3069751 RepID=UPI0027B7E772|nr:tRNA (adenosine(37)-N6)-threonylcarbamoyltransferase complex dimerization subunit type 1 TsaB [Marinimicrobium sp. ABcell2]MDQ2077171.1 tRNA (adenosine(37)-N6)-threonylcarbamoyltransferase complex dimerization subunit type 1 TsaB [Marinimicrobium sp. ABcell2]